MLRNWFVLFEYSIYYSFYLKKEGIKRNRIKFFKICGLGCSFIIFYL